MTIRIASYNLWNGADKSFNRLIDFAKTQAFDVLCLQEINGWQNNDFARLKEFVDRAEYDDYIFGNSNSEYKMATVSMLPIEFSDIYVEGFWHCVILSRIQVDGFEITVVHVHLDPWHEEPRLKELQRLFNLIDINRPTIIVGDINSVSREDNYPPEFLSELQKRNFTKFGQNSLDYRVTDYLANAGLVDAAAKIGKFDTTAPSLFGTYSSHEEIPASEAPARIDYFFVSENLAPLIKNYEVIKTNTTNHISDHYPIVLTLETNGDGDKENGVIKRTKNNDFDTEHSENAESQSYNTEGEIRLH
jgi:exodeoxyribonuclease III